jgi:phospholipid/cholesterol/gamma-HCH transport system substrate-binding protein
MKNISRILALPFLLLAIGCTDTYQVTVVFDNVEGLDNKAEVLVHGLHVGEVDKMDLTPDGVAVTLDIETKYKIPTGSEFFIESSGFIGPNHIAVKYAKEKQYLAEGDTLRGTVKPETDRLIDLDSLVINFAKALKEDTNDTIAKVIK